MEGSLIPKHGGYQNLKSFQNTTYVYDLTVEFCNKYIDRFSRTKDQMVQAARSGRQNIAEGCMASATSKKTEIKLIGVARASLEELLLDYQDFLRQKGFSIWSKDNRRVKAIRLLAYRLDRSYKTSENCLHNPEVAANTIICLIHQANYLLDKQLMSLGKAFLDEGGFTERLYKARKNKQGF